MKTIESLRVKIIHTKIFANKKSKCILTKMAHFNFILNLFTSHINSQAYIYEGLRNKTDFKKPQKKNGLQQF